MSKANPKADLRAVLNTMTFQGVGALAAAWALHGDHPQGAHLLVAVGCCLGAMAAVLARTGDAAWRPGRRTWAQIGLVATSMTCLAASVIAEVSGHAGAVPAASATVLGILAALVSAEALSTAVEGPREASTAT